MVFVCYLFQYTTHAGPKCNKIEEMRLFSSSLFMANKLSIDFYSHSPIGDVHNSYLVFFFFIFSFGYSLICICWYEFNSLFHLHLPEEEATNAFLRINSDKKK